MNPCEILEDLVLASSSCPATDIIIVVPNEGTGSTLVLLDVGMLTSTVAYGSSDLAGDAYLFAADQASATETVTSSTLATTLVVERGRAQEGAALGFHETVSEQGTATSTLAGDRFDLLSSVGYAQSTVSTSNKVSALVTESGQGASSLSVSSEEQVEEGAVVTDAVTLQRYVEALLAETAEADTATFLFVPAFELLADDTGEAADSVVLQLYAQALLEEVGHALSDASFKDPSRIAWVLNTETTALSWYENFGFESIAQLPDRVLAIGPDGLYELSGTNDSGDQIDAQVVTGLTDFGVLERKRLDEVLVAYTSSNKIALTVEAFGTSGSGRTYAFASRTPSEMRPARAKIGKGFNARYWRFTFKNVDGAAFEVRDAVADVVASSRRF